MLTPAIRANVISSSFSLRAVNPQARFFTNRRPLPGFASGGRTLIFQAKGGGEPLCAAS